MEKFCKILFFSLPLATAAMSWLLYILFMSMSNDYGEKISKISQWVLEKMSDARASGMLICSTTVPPVCTSADNNSLNTGWVQCINFNQNFANLEHFFIYKPTFWIYITVYWV